MKERTAFKKAWRWCGVAFFAILLVMTGPIDKTATGSQGDSDGCVIEHVDGLGPACLHNDGLWEVFSPSGESLGFTHGLDPVPVDEDLSAQTHQALTCVDPTLDPYHTVVIYARAYDDTDRYHSVLGDLRSLVTAANGVLKDSAVATGGTASIETICSGEKVVVYNEVLPTSMASASFSTIASDLKDAGFDEGRKKYWVFYDDSGACTCGGTGHVYHDPDKLPTNLNNGNGFPMFAVNFGYLSSTRIMLHELGHNMGAVQNDSPNTTGAYHCIDGSDIMCYNDGGPRGDSYTTAVCGSPQRFDCNNDDYFHLCPPQGSYLDSHWNVGSSFNRFLTFDMVRIPPYLC